MAKIRVTYRLIDSQNQVVGGGLLHPNGSHFDYRSASIYDPQFFIDTNEMDISYVCRRALGLKMKPMPLYPCAFKFESVPCKWELSNYSVVYTMEMLKDENVLEAREAFTLINYALKNPVRILGHN
jgi:hypothetical protein